MQWHAEEAIAQITPNGALGEQRNYIDEVKNESKILLVVINYSSTKDHTKAHTCIIEKYK